MVFALHTEKKAKLWSDYKSTIDTPWLADRIQYVEQGQLN